MPENKISEYMEYTFFIGNCATKDPEYILRIHELLEEEGFLQRDSTNLYEGGSAIPKLIKDLLGKDISITKIPIKKFLM